MHLFCQSSAYFQSFVFLTKEIYYSIKKMKFLDFKMKTPHTQIRHVMIYIAYIFEFLINKLISSQLNLILFRRDIRLSSQIIQPFCWCSNLIDNKINICFSEIHFKRFIKTFELFSNVFFCFFLLKIIRENIW